MEYLNDDAQFEIALKRIDRTPTVLVNELFVPVEIGTGVVGYWIDDKTNQLHMDNIRIETYAVIYQSEFLARIKSLFDDGELCVFYKDIYNLGTLRHPDGNYDILQKRIEIIEYKKPRIEYIEELTRQHGGCTVYRLDGGVYLIEIYTK